MPGASPPEAVAGLFLVFFLPGYALTRAMFPEWRLRGPAAFLRLVETVTLAFVLSVGLTVLAGYLLLTVAPGGFRAYWSDPVLEAVLAGITVVAFVAGWVEGAYRREPPSTHVADGGLGDEGAWELTRELDRLGREERRLNHALRTLAVPSDEPRIREELTQVRARREELRQVREVEYAS
ncbi:MAG: DUF1616 domain-containing protein [Thermoplasmata archaeon]